MIEEGGGGERKTDSHLLFLTTPETARISDLEGEKGKKKKKKRVTISLPSPDRLSAGPYIIQVREKRKRGREEKKGGRPRLLFSSQFFANHLMNKTLGERKRKKKGEKALFTVIIFVLGLFAGLPA